MSPEKVTRYPRRFFSRRLLTADVLYEYEDVRDHVNHKFDLSWLVPGAHYHDEGCVLLNFTFNLASWTLTRALDNNFGQANFQKQILESGEKV